MTDPQREWEQGDDLARLKLAIEQSRERTPSDDEDYGYNHGLEEANRLIDKLQAGKLRMTSSGRVEVLEG